MEKMKTQKIKKKMNHLKKLNLYFQNIEIIKEELNQEELEDLVIKKKNYLKIFKM